MDGQIEDMLNNDGDFVGFFEGGGTLNITVRRTHLLEDTLKYLSTQSKNFKK